MFLQLIIHLQVVQIVHKMKSGILVTWLRVESFRFIFDTSGLFPYHCIPHSGLGTTGMITVDPSAIAGDVNGDGAVNHFDI